MAKSKIITDRFGALMGILGLMVALIAISSAQASANALGIPDLEYNALVALYNGTNGPGWSDNTNWLTAAAPWDGVTVENGHVTSLSLNWNSLAGQIPSQLSALTNLQYLDLNQNQLTGQIPTQLGSLTKLWYLDLSYNQLSGQIPAQLASISALQGLLLKSNQLTGQIPVQLWRMTGLADLELNDNQLTGQLPADIGNMTGLWVLMLYNNQLTGPIPSQIGNLTNLRYLFTDGNPFGGQIPSQLGNLTNLQQLSLWGNHLTGSIPSALGNLSNLTFLGLSNNQLTGQIPAQLGNLTHLTNLYLDSNLLTGSIPPQMGQMSSLQELFLNNNMLSGQIPSEMGNLTHLMDMDLASNQLNGEIPSSLMNLTNLESGMGILFELNFNSLSASGSSLLAFLADNFPFWDQTQTVPPTNVTAVSTAPGSVKVSWTPIKYTSDSGYYEVGVSQTSGGPYVFSTANRTASKTAASILLSGLPTQGGQYFVVRTVTLANANNLSTLTSAPSGAVTVTAPSRPRYVKIRTLVDPAHNLTPPNPVAIAGRVVATSPLQVFDGGSAVVVQGVTATAGQFVFVTGIWDGTTLSAVGPPVVYSPNGP